MKKTILVTGANGFTGRFVCLELLKRKIPFIAVLSPKGDASWMKNNSIDYKKIDINDVEKMQQILLKCSALLNVASIGFGAAPALIEACEKSGIKRTIFVSTTSIFTKLNASSKSIRLLAERSIMNSKLNWTIIRPTMIYGTENDRNMIKIIKWMKNKKFIPIFGDGKSLQQPIFVKDLSWSLVEILDNQSTYFKCFNLSGKEALTFLDVINTIDRNLNKKTIKFFIPAFFIIILLTIAEKIGIRLPIKAEQVKRLNENKSFDHDDAKKIFNYSPTSFKKGISKEINNFLKV